jgi:hypothetical protein
MIEIVRIESMSHRRNSTMEDNRCQSLENIQMIASEYETDHQ